MIANRELGLEDYLTMARRRLKVIVLPALVTTLAGFIISFAFSPKYTSTSLILVERQTVPAGYVKPIVTAAVSDRILTLQQQVLSRNQLQALANRLQLVRNGKSLDDVIDDIQSNVTITEANPSTLLRDAQTPSSNSLKRGSYVPGFYIRFTTNNARNAQQICSEITSMLLAENLRAREEVASSTTSFLTRQLEEAKHDLDERDKQLAAFKNRYLGQLPGDMDGNLKVLSGLDSQLNANMQMLNRAQQDKSYAESVLAQQIMAWKSSQTAMTSDTIGEQLATLQTQLVALEARYTENHPEVIKMKNDIAGLKAKQKELKVSLAQNESAEIMDGKAEPPVIRQLRQQVHQSETAITRATSEQKRLQEQIGIYQSRLTLSPTVEEEYKQLTRDNETAQKIYADLLVNKSESEVQTDLEHRQQGEQLRLLDPASLPNAPSFPVRWKFVAGGVGVGLILGIVIAMWLEFRDKAIRNEADVVAGLELPMLISIPWVDLAPAEGGDRGRFKVLGNR